MRNGLGDKIRRCVGVVLCALLISFNAGEQMQYVRELSGNLSMEELSELSAHMGGAYSLSMDEDDSIFVGSDKSETLGEKGGTASVRLFGAIPIKRISYSEKQDVRVMPGGMSIGVSIYTSGALVVGLGSVDESGACPAADGGIKAGDIITEVNGEIVLDSLHLSKLCNTGGRELRFSVRRGDEAFECVVRPRYDAEEELYKVGMWVRDSTSGIGTLSFYNMDTGRYGALGHPITDIDTGTTIDVKEGHIIASDIIGVSAGTSGVPGEVIGSFSLSSRRMGTIDQNGAFGIYGDMTERPVNPLYPDGVLIASQEEIQTGEAQILSTVNDEGVKAYSCEILKLYRQEDISGKGMVIRVTDSSLIESTGGIVQGMSGSPVLQNGKLVGAVTHVFVNDAQCGYCIYASWMNEMASRAA